MLLFIYSYCLCYSRAVVEISGCSSIFGVPMPNGFSAEQLSSHVPEGVLTASLSHVAHVVDCICSILNVPLPHEVKTQKAAYQLMRITHLILSQLSPFGMFECAVVAPGNDKR